MCAWWPKVSCRVSVVVVRQKAMMTSASIYLSIFGAVVMTTGDDSVVTDTLEYNMPLCNVGGF